MKKTEIKRKTAMKPGKGFAAMRTELRRTKLLPVSGKKAAGKAVAMRASIRRKRAVPATPEQRERWNQMIGVGCVACLMGETNHGLFRVSFLMARTTQLRAEKLGIHHLLSGGKRMGHDFTVCLCRYHHQGDFLVLPGCTYVDHAKVYGPSLAHEGKRFHEIYGSELKILEYQNNVLAHIPVILPRVGPPSKLLEGVTR